MADNAVEETETAELRTIAVEYEVREKGGKPVIVGRIPYNSLSVDLGGFRERMMPGVFAEHLRSKPDIPAKYDHGKRGMGLPLGRTGNDTLRLKDGPEALEFEIDPPDTSDARDLVVSAERRDTKGTSFGFRVKKGGERWFREGDSTIREVTNAELTEVSPTPDPAYPESSIAVARRSLECWQEEQRALEAEKRAIKPGHFVRFMHADGPKSAHMKVGKVIETRSDGRLSMPMGGMYCEGTRDNPAHMVAEYRDDDGDGVHEPSGHMHLVNERDVEKMDDADTITDEQALTLVELLEKHEQEELQARQDRLRLLSLGPTMDEGGTLDGAPSYE